MNTPRVLVITPVKHIKGVFERLVEFSSVTYAPEASIEEVIEMVPGHQAIFVNPNKSKVYLGEQTLLGAEDLKVICTASTGTTHIDLEYASSRGIAVLSLAEERNVINKISCTAEHAFTLTMATLRNVVQAQKHVLDGLWNYEPFIGRQMDHLTVGVLGYGRLGRYYSDYCRCFGSTVVVYDPFKSVDRSDIQQVSEIGELLRGADIISIHVHATEDTFGLVDESWFVQMKRSVLLVNTSRGDVVNEADLVVFLRENPAARYSTDVLAKETRERSHSPVLDYAKESTQVLITPHIGGMTVEGQHMAYSHAANMLKDFLGRSSGDRENDLSGDPNQEDL